MKFLSLNISNFFITVLFLSFYSISFSQEPLDDHNFVTVNEDITQRAITSIFKDNSGYMWIGTYGDGIFRYNSNGFKNYKQEWNSKENSLNSSLIQSTLLDKQNNIWIGTQYGLNLYNSDFDRFDNIDLAVDNKTNTFAVHALADFDNDTILIGTHEHGLFKLSKKDYRHQKIPYKENKPVNDLLINAIVKSPNGRFLIGTNYGLMTFDPYSEILQLARFNTETDYNTIEAYIESLLVTKDNSVWIGTSSSGLIKLFENDKGLYTIENYPITNKRILSLAEKSDHTVLCATENDGLFGVNYVTGSVNNYRYDKSKQYGIKSNSIWSVYTDEKDRIWLGYYNNGIDVYDNNYNKFNAIKSVPSQPNSLNSNSVTGIISDAEGRLWISMSNGGVDVYDPKEKTFVNLFNQDNTIAKGLNRLGIQTIFKDSKENIWVGTWNSGLFFLKHNQKHFINVNTSSPNSVLKSNRVMSFDEDSKGTIWIGTFLSGLYSYNPMSDQFTYHNSSEFTKFNISTSNIRKVLVDHEDNIWLGTRTGLYKIEKNSNTSSYEITSLNKKMNEAIGKSVVPSIVFILYEDDDNQIWIGTFDKGLFKYNPKQDSIKWYNANNGLVHETISSIIQDDAGNLWIGGNAGLSKLDIEENTFVNFNKKDGLLSNGFNSNSVYKTSNNELYFGNSKGINYFNPDSIIYNQEKPSVYLTDLKISNEKVSPSAEDSPLEKVISKTSDITLNHNQSSFSIDFVGINYTRSENNQYAYYLEGFDNQWNYVETNRSATYKNVPPGKYTFKVKASNNDGVWNENPTTLNVVIRPAWWATNLAIFSYVLLALLLLYVVYRIVNERIKEKRVLNLERQEHKQFEALNAKKIQFFTNISHEFRTPLTLILTPLEDIIQEEHEFSIDIKEKHNIIYKNAKRLSRLINELMDFRKLQFNKMSINASQINVIPFIEEVVGHFEEEASIKNIILTLEYEENDIVIWSDPSMLEKIIFNLLSNAFKATPEGGLITIQVNEPKDPIILPLIDTNEPVKAIEVVIKDTGLGIKEENLYKVFDRFYQSNEMDNQYYGGTGIGLELVKSFVDLHKGKILLESEPNAGTEFKIYFPLGYSHLKEDVVNKNNKKAINQYSESKNENLEEAEIVTDKKSLNKKIVLIVEDNIELRNYLKKELKSEYIIKMAENGLEGLEKANKFIPDVIITDVMMPIMDGFEFCERIKSDLKTSHIPLLMVTAKGMQMDKVKGIDSGADVYLNKPFNMRVLKSHLKQLISSRQILFDKYFNSVNASVDSDNTTSLDKEFINNVLNYINDNISDEKLNVENLANELLLSRSKLYRKIKALTGNTANEFIRRIRLEKAKELIENSEYNINEICYKVGFSSPSYFTKCFVNHFEILPTELRRDKEEK